MESKVEQWQRLISEQASSGETITGYCRRVGVSTSSFDYWRTKISGKKKGEFVRVGGAPLEVVLPSGVIIRVEKEDLPGVLEALNV